MLNPRRMRFAPRPFATLATVVAVLAFAALAQWQLNRAAEKRELAADFARAGPAVALPADTRELPRYQHVTVRGRYDAERQFLLDNRIRDGRVGVEILTPLLRDDGGTVLVNRGWQPFGASRQDLPDVAVSPVLRRISGRLDELPRAGIALEAPPATGWPKLVSFPTAKQLTTMLGQEVAPRMILLDSAEPDGYLRDWKLHGTSSDRNFGYAIQWYAFAVTAIAIWLAVSLRRHGEES